jgi:hypothetical protein
MTIKQSFAVAQNYYITGDPGEEKGKFKDNWSGAEDEPIAAPIDNSVSNAVKLKPSNAEEDRESETKELDFNLAGGISRPMSGVSSRSRRNMRPGSKGKQMPQGDEQLNFV